MPLLFLANHGQAPPPVRFLAKAPGLTVCFSPGEVLFGVAGNTLRMRFEGADGASLPEAAGPAPGSGEFPDRIEGPMAAGAALVWRRRLSKPLSGNRYGLRGAGRNLKSEFVVAPRADPSAIRVRYLGGGSPRIARDGSLAIPAGAEEFARRPRWYIRNAMGGVLPWVGGFVLAGEAVSFAIGAYDASLPLIIDPAISYGTLLGGSGANAANALAVDSTGGGVHGGLHRVLQPSPQPIPCRISMPGEPMSSSQNWIPRTAGWSIAPTSAAWATIRRTELRWMPRAQPMSRDRRLRQTFRSAIRCSPTSRAAETRLS